MQNLFLKYMKTSFWHSEETLFSCFFKKWGFFTFNYLEYQIIAQKNEARYFRIHVVKLPAFVSFLISVLTDWKEYSLWQMNDQIHLLFHFYFYSKFLQMKTDVVYLVNTPGKDCQFQLQRQKHPARTKHLW